MGRGDHAADEHALNQPQDHEQHGRDNARLGNRRQQSESGRADADTDDGDQHRVLAAVNIGIVAEHRGADRAHQQRHRERGVDRRQRQRRDAGRKEQRADDRRHVQQNEKLEKIERPSQYRRHDGVAHLPGFRRRYRFDSLYIRDCHFIPPCFTPKFLVFTARQISAGAWR